MIESNVDIFLILFIKCIRLEDAEVADDREKAVEVAEADVQEDQVEEAAKEVHEVEKSI